mmetsp:Transcript_27472/g.72200  ORF Transcript_27472/g.72200 Transcript_27472/m.72200 type:complete len:359 (-) Transcript_27472:89-1165(-)
MADLAAAAAASASPSAEVFVTDTDELGDDAVAQIADALNLQHISDRESEIETLEAMVKKELIPSRSSSPRVPSRMSHSRSGSASANPPGSPLAAASPAPLRRRSSHNPIHNGPGGLRRSNSTGTLFVDSTVSQPNREDTLACVGLALHCIIVDGHEQDEPLLLAEKFDERRWPLTAKMVPDDYDKRIPSDSDIFSFMDRLFEAASLSAECGIITLVYINRCIQYTGLAMHASNWKRIVLGGILMASKVWDDQAVWNVDYCSILPRIDIEEMNELERTFLEMLQFNINVDSSVYTKYYFELRQLAEEAERPFPLEPMSKERAAQLEASAKHIQDAVIKADLRGAKSLGHDEFMHKAVLP